MSFLCIPGVFGRRKDRENDHYVGSDSDFGGNIAGTDSANSSTGQDGHSRSPSSARNGPSTPLSLPPTPEGVPSHTGGTTSPSLFQGATALQFEDFRYIDASRASNVVVHGNTESLAISASEKGWELLAKYASPNALHNSRARYDPPKCDEGTRVALIAEIMDWLRDRMAPCRLLCMTGAAGSGKSALQQTVAEICASQGILASSFFFSSTDNTRNNVSTVIPTIAYQLGTKSTGLRQSIGAIVKDNPLIFEQSLSAQIYSLIIHPIMSLPDKSDAIPHAILIDGIDECHDEGHQVELIMAIHKELLLRETPFRIVISSRPEWPLRNALQPHGHLHGLTYHVRLSDLYDATADIRRTLWRRLREVGACSTFPSAQGPLWPPEDVVEKIVKAASGQYIYVATVIRYVSERRASPVERLRAFLAWSSSGEANPFAGLDLLYTNILSRAKEAYEAAGNKGNFCVLLQAYAYFFNPEGGYFFPIDTVDKSVARFGHDRLLSMDDGTCELLISDLRSLLGIAGEVPGHARPGPTLNFYHQSFKDFLQNESRSKHLHVPRRAVDQYLAECLLRYFARSAELTNGDESLHGTTPPGYPWLALVSFTLLPYLLLRVDDMYKALVQFTDQGGWEDVTRWMDFLLERSKSCDINIDSAAHWYEFLDRFVEELEDSTDVASRAMIEPATVASEAAYSVLHHTLRPAHRSPSPEGPEDRVCFCAYHTGVQAGHGGRGEWEETKESKRLCLLRYHGFRSADVPPSLSSPGSGSGR